jgi:hypothetical protein
MNAIFPNPAVNWTASTLRVPAASYFARWALNGDTFFWQ